MTAHDGNWNRDYASLSVYDLLSARDARHAQFARNPNVIGTAIGRYLIRPGEEDVHVGRGADVRKIAEAHKNGGVRSAATASVQRDSWPCVLVFVRKMMPPGDVDPEHYIDPFIVVETDRPPRVIVAPVCVVEAPIVPVEARPLPVQVLPALPIGGGYPIFANVQGKRHTGSAGCLVTDGRAHYILTNRHVAGPPGTEIFPSMALGNSRLGVTAESIGRLPFNDVWPLLPPSRSTSPLDAALIELDDVGAVTAKVLRPETSGSDSIPKGAVLGPLLDIDELALDVDWIGRDLEAFGAVSGSMHGRILGVMYRYIDEGGTDYTCDVLINNADATVPTMLPGDSGTLWTYTDHAKRARPFAIQWGGEHHRFDYGSKTQTFALATFASNATRALDVRIETDLNVEGTEYWGQTGHFEIGDVSPDFIRDKALFAFFDANRSLLSNNPKMPWNDMTGKAADFVGLADVPDVVWRNSRFSTEGPNHYIDLDLTGFKTYAKTTVSDVLTEKNYDPAAVQALYDDANTDPNRPADSHHPGKLKNFDGMLPWRVAQLFNEMVKAVAAKDIEHFFVAAGVLAHYVGDGCQSLHGEKWTNGRPGETPGAHGAYEDAMLDDNDTFDPALQAYIKAHLDGRKAPGSVTSGLGAAKAVHDLLMRTQKLLPPDAILDAYQTLLKKHTKANGTHDNIGVAHDLWTQFGDATLKAIFDGCNTLALLWDSAWTLGKGDAALLTKSGKPAKLSQAKLATLVADASVCRSYALSAMIATPALWK